MISSRSAEDEEDEEDDGAEVSGAVAAVFAFFEDEKEESEAMAEFITAVAKSWVRSLISDLHRNQPRAFTFLHRAVIKIH